MQDESTEIPLKTLLPGKFRTRDQKWRYFFLETDYSRNYLALKMLVHFSVTGAYGPSRKGPLGAQS